ncbi:MAG: hypothetical protein RBU21_00945, partial [FCB group bacterium]|nr:hypothetical protein [FCB group bacterium]
MALLPIVAWFVFERYLQIEAYRPALEKKIADTTGLPVSIGRLDLTLNPLPVIQADTITVGQGDFRLAAERALIEPDMQALLHRDIRLTAVDLFELNAVMPADPAELRSRLREVSAHMAKPKSGKIKIVLDRIRAEQATLFLGTAQKPIFTGDLDLLDVLSPTPSGRIDAAVVAMRDEIRGGGEFSVRRGPGGKGIEAFKGAFSMDGLQLAKVVKNQKTPRVLLEVDGAFSGTDTRNLTVNLSGDIEPAANARQLGESLEGPFLAKAIWDGTTVRLEDVRWKAAGLELAGDVARTEDGAYRLSIPSATVGAYTLNPLFAMMPSKTFRIEAGQEASVGLEDLAVSLTRDKQPGLERGRITLVGINLINAEQKDIARNVKGALVLEDGTVRVEGLKGAGLELTGTVVPDFGAKVAKLDLKGTFALSRESLQPVLNVKSIQEVGGSVKLERIAGTFGSGKGLPKDFVLEGSTEKARLSLKTAGFVDVFNPVSATFTTEGKV